MTCIKTGLWHIGTLVLAGVSLGCPSSSDRAPADAAPSAASQAPAWVPPPREGCVRSGELEGIEADPSCVVPHAEASVTRDAMRLLVLELNPDVPAIVGGGTVLLRLTIANRGTTEAELVFTAQPPGAVARPDWTRLAGVPELRQAVVEGFHLSMPVRTRDSHERSVDGLPTTPQLAAAARLLRVRLRPGAKLTHTFAWWALRIPAPLPIFYDDAGHRFVPKTAPLPLAAGEYVIAIDLPLYGVSPAESVVSTHLQVDKIEKPDGGASLH